MSDSSSSTGNSKLTLYLAALIVNSITFSSSLNLCWSSTTIPVLLSEESPLDSGPITKEETSWVVALSCLGSLFSTPIYFFLVHNYNRKFIGYLVTVPFIIGWIIIIISKSVTLLYIARFIGGMGNGAALVFPPVYISEIAEDSIRGALGSFLMLFLNIGILFGYIIGAYVNYYTYAYIGILFPLLFIFCYYWLPETPMYLIKIGESNKAKRSLSYLRGKNEEVVQREFSKMSNFLKDREEEPESKTFKGIFTARGNRRALFIGLVLAANIQLSGVYVVYSYTVSIFQDTGTYLSPYVSSIIIGCLNLLGVCLSSLLIDKAGRKILLLASDITMMLCLIAVGCFFFLKNRDLDVSIIQWLPVLSLSSFIFAFSVGLSPVSFVVIAEIFEPEVKAKATTFILSTIWIVAFLVSKFYTNLTDVLGSDGCFWFFASFCFLGTIYIFFEVPETKNRSYESILMELHRFKNDKITGGSKNEAQTR